MPKRTANPCFELSYIVGRKEYKMKIVVINGNMRHGSTWNCVDIFKKNLSRYSEIEVTEFFLPRDMPHFCNGCFSCFYNGENTCPHSASISPIVEALENSDVIVLASPVYGMDVTGQMKTLLDHLCFMWLSHRPNPALFNKVGVIICTTAGAGLSHTVKTMKNSLTFWGVKRVFAYKKAVSAMKWDDVDSKKKADIDKKMNALAKKVARTVNNIDKLSPPFFTRFMFTIMKGMMKKNTWNPQDRNHWESQNWLKGSKPY